MGHVQVIKDYISGYKSAKEKIDDVTTSTCERDSKKQEKIRTTLGQKSALQLYNEFKAKVLNELKKLQDEYHKKHPSEIQDD
jgi:hypothetical protein